jgi:hypothetical protein
MQEDASFENAVTRAAFREFSLNKKIISHSLDRPALCREQHPQKRLARP